MARPRKQIDENQVYELARIHCTHEEIAAVLGCSTKLLQRRFVHLIEKGKEAGRASLRRSMYKAADSGNVVMMIWLSKQHLGMSDKVESKTVSAPVSLRIIRPDGDGDGDDGAG